MCDTANSRIVHVVVLAAYLQPLFGFWHSMALCLRAKHDVSPVLWWRGSVSNLYTPQVLRESSLSYRQPKSFFAKWKPVYVRLSASALSILPSQGAAVPDAVFELSPTMRVEVSDARRFAFSVVVDDQELVFDATDDTDRERWIDQLSACLVMQRQTVCSPTPGYSPRAYGAPQAQPFPQAQPQTERAPMPSGGSDKAKKPAGVPAGVPAGPGPIDISGVHLRRTGKRRVDTPVPCRSYAYPCRRIEHSFTCSTRQVRSRRGVLRRIQSIQFSAYARSLQRCNQRLY
jgi:hypothetical protein